MASPFKTSLLLAALLACSGGYAQSTMTRDQAKAEHDRIEATAKADKKACDTLKGNAEDVCEAEAKAKEKVAKAELRYQQSGKEGDRIKVDDVKAEAAYEVAKEKCEDLQGDQQSQCKKDAKAQEQAARKAAKAGAGSTAGAGGMR